MKFNKTQWAAVAGCTVLLLGVYLFADTKKIAHEKPAGPAASRDIPKEPSSYDWAGYVAKVKAAISNQDTLNIIAGHEKSASVPDMQSLLDLYHGRGESIMEAYYTQQLALLKKDAKLALRAGDLYGATSAISNDEALHQYLIDRSVESYQTALGWDSTTDTRLRLASAYMDQGTAPMQGVGILLEVVSKDSNNADAQFLLGKFGIVSRQYDKAIVRLEKVVHLRPQNYDALFLLAEAYRGKGDKAKALALLEKCSAMVDKPELKKEINEYIRQLKTGS
jgi:tetratricopeptide (TPR) repeat protein